MKEKKSLCCHPGVILIAAAMLLVGLYLILKAPKAASILNLPTSKTQVTPTKAPTEYTKEEIDQKIKNLDESTKELDSSLNATDINLGL